MKIKLVFDDWKKDYKSVYGTEKGFDLSIGSFHSGTTFNAEIELKEWEEEDLKKSLEDRFAPYFYVIESDIKEKKIRVFVDNKNNIYDISDLYKMKKALIKVLKNQISIGHFSPFPICGHKLDFTLEDISNFPKSLQKEAKKILKNKEEISLAPKKMKEYINSVEERIINAKSEEGLCKISKELDDEWEIGSFSLNSYLK